MEIAGGVKLVKGVADGAAKHVNAEDDHKSDLVLYRRFTCTCPRYNPDSGCSDHLCKDNNTMVNLVPSNRRIWIVED